MSVKRVLAIVFVLLVQAVVFAQPTGPEPVRAIAGTNLLVNGDFEGSGGWTVTADGGQDVLCTVGTCGTAGDTQGPSSGDGFARLGGSDVYDGISQTVTLPADELLVLAFGYWLGKAELAPGHDFGGQPVISEFRIRVDDILLGYTTQYSLGQQYGYTTIAWDISAFGDGLEHTLEFEVFTAFGDDDANIWSVDNAAIYATDATNILVNGSFETPEGTALLKPWKWAGTESGRSRCNKLDKTYAKKGNCALEVSKLYFRTFTLRQTIRNSELAEPLVPGDVLAISAWHTTGGHGITYPEFQVRVFHSDGVREKHIFRPETTAQSWAGGVTRAGPIWPYYPFFSSSLLTFIVKDVDRIKVFLYVSGYPTSGTKAVKAYIDDIKLLRISAGARSAPLAVPPAP